MSTSKIKLFKVGFTPEKNAKIEDIETYLGQQVVAYTNNNFGYVQIGLDIKIKVESFGQVHQTEADFNYCRIEQDLIPGHLYSNIYYFFVTGVKWISQSGLEISLSLDTINTFQDLTFTNKTNVIREHRNRFYNDSPIEVGQTNYFRSKIDKTDEGVQVVKYKYVDNTISESGFYSNKKWYLLYTTPEVPTAVNPINVFLVPDTPVQIGQSGSGSITYPITTIGENETWYIIYSNNIDNSTTISWTGTSADSIRIGSLRSGRTVRGFAIKRYRIYVLTEFSEYLQYENILVDSDCSITFSNSLHYNVMSGTNITADLKKIIDNSTQRDLNTTTGINQCYSMAEVDRTDSKIIKIIECPYAPVPLTRNALTGNLVIPTGWSIFENNKIKLIDLNLAFEHDLTTQSIFHDQGYLVTDQNFDELPRFLDDPKLQHSSFTEYKLSYDNFNIQIFRELITRDTSHFNSAFTITYKQSHDIISDLLFKFSPLYCTYTQTQDYDLILVSNRNNEISLYNSSYLEYMRTGFNYDKKIKNQETARNVFTTGLQIAGSIISFAASTVTSGLSVVAGISLATSATASIGNTIYSATQKEQSLNQKLVELQERSTNIRNSESLDLLNYYNGNKLHRIEYTPSELMTKYLNDLFYYCGYATNEKKVPNTNTRWWFNYLQCEADFDESTVNTYKNYIDDIKARYQAGVTIYHHHQKRVGTTQLIRDIWDLEQHYENWESVLIS